MLLKSTTRHVRIFTADVVDNNLQFHPNKLTIDLDPDNEFIWNEESLNKVNQKFNELVKERAGKNLDDYELRKIGSEIEGLIKFLLQNGKLSYNPDCRVMNYSMGLPKDKRNAVNRFSNRRSGRGPNRGYYQSNPRDGDPYIQRNKRLSSAAPEQKLILILEP